MKDLLLINYMSITFKLSFTFFKPQVRQKGRDKSHVRQVNAKITLKIFDFFTSTRMF